jgi:hypothetical protein
MSDQPTQTVVSDSSNSGAGASTADTGAGAQGGGSDDFETLLAEFSKYGNEGGGGDKTAGAATTGPDKSGQGEQLTREEIAELRALRDTTRQQQSKQAVESVIKSVKGEDLGHLDNDFVEYWLNKQAVQDPRIADAFAQRSRNPAGWSKMEAALGRRLAEQHGKPIDSRATSTRVAVNSAVRGASTQTPAEDAPDFASMSNADFDKAKQGIFSRNKG